MKKSKRKVIAIILALLWMIMIFMFSAQNATSSAELSGGIEQKILSTFYPGFDDMTEEQQQELLSHFNIRKIAHFVAYFVLGILMFNIFVIYKKFSLLVRGLFSLICCVAYAAGDEIHQYFVPGRSCELRDVFIDSSGAILSITILCLYCGFSKKMKDRVK